ncbi:HPr family phosphocarrier protein [Peribacillus sp. B-H-3]|jgi:hypothetical protein|uniref:HPr family phosphocarrier protein n=1 Tax=Peribacillus sp. B-H-3 TaxID=3400420 RepID=UPI003B01EF95
MMSELISTEISLNKKLTMRQLMELYQITKNSGSTAYFMCKQKIVDSAKLSGLVSFMLTLNECSDIKVIIEGANVQETLQNIKDCCHSSTLRQNDKFKYFANPEQTIQI